MKYGWLLETPTETTWSRVFIKYIIEAERRKIQEELKDAKFFSVLSDGSTDCAVKEEELVYARFCKEGNMELRFVGIQAVEKADSTYTAQATKSQMVVVCMEWEGKLIACATNGAAVMTRWKSGVVTTLRGDKAYGVVVHRMAHRLTNKNWGNSMGWPPPSSSGPFL